MLLDTEQLHEMRPDILGGTLAIEDDGTFTETVAFTDEEAPARASSCRCPTTCARRLETLDARREVPRPAPPVVRVEQLTSVRGEDQRRSSAATTTMSSSPTSAAGMTRRR